LCAAAFDPSTFDLCNKGGRIWKDPVVFTEVFFAKPGSDGLMKKVKIFTISDVV
jgi:hypothetical protein